MVDGKVTNCASHKFGKSNNDSVGVYAQGIVANSYLRGRELKAGYIMQRKANDGQRSQ